MGSIACFGLVFNDFVVSLGKQTSAVTIITACFFCTLSFAGLFTNTLFKKFSIRTVGLFGAVLYFAGSLMTIFVTSIDHLIVSFGIFQGSIVILMLKLNSNFINYEFEKRYENLSVVLMKIKSYIFRRCCWIYNSRFVYHIQSIFYNKTSGNDERSTIFNRNRNNDIPNASSVFDGRVRLSWYSGNNRGN